MEKDLLVEEVIEKVVLTKKDFAVMALAGGCLVTLGALTYYDIKRKKAAKLLGVGVTDIYWNKEQKEYQIIQD